MQNKELYSPETFAVRVFGLVMVIIFLIFGILSSCSGSRIATTRSEETDTLKHNISGIIPAERIQGKGLDIGEELVYQTPEFNYSLERISNKYYLEKRTEREVRTTKKEMTFIPTKTTYKDKRRTELNYNSGNKIDDHSKENVDNKNKTDDHSKDKSNKDSGNKSKVDDHSKVKDKSGSSYWWILLIIPVYLIWNNRAKIIPLIRKVFIGL